MKKNKYFYIVVVFVLFSTFSDSISGRSKMGKKYKLVFCDEFNLPDYSQPDSSKWVRDRRHVGGDYIRWISDSKDVVYIKNHHLICRAIKNTNKEDTAAMLTGAITTLGKYSFKYGKIEVKLRTRKHQGNFPAAWLLPAFPTKRAPFDGEIDIFEGIDDQDIAYHTAHNQWTAEGHRNTPISHFESKVDVSKWHVYGLIWDENFFSWTVDGKIVGTYYRFDDEQALSHRQWPYNQHFYIILNQSVGSGHWAKKADENFVYETEFDWVRVYQ